nr:hypothetical protein [uncultured Rhodopila sp.]
MTDPTIAFLPQPVETLAREGEVFAQRVIDTLHGWVRSNCIDNVVTELHKRIFVLSEPASDWNMVVILRAAPESTKWGVDVCSVGFSGADSLMEHFRPLVDVDGLASVMQVSLHKIEPAMFSVVAESFASTPLYAACGRPLIYGHTLDLMHDFDRNAYRWVSSKARTNFKTLLDDARQRPQLVEREDDDLFVVSRRYLQEAIEPTSARGLSRIYRAMALSDAGMPDLVPRALAPLEDLPKLGPA